MPRQRATLLLKSAADSMVRVNLRTGLVTHKPPPLVYENSRNAAPRTSFSLTDSIRKIEAGVLAGEMRATAAVRQGWRDLNERLAQQEEDRLLEENPLGFA